MPNQTWVALPIALRWLAAPCARSNAFNSIVELIGDGPVLQTDEAWLIIMLMTLVPFPIRNADRHEDYK